MEVLFGNPCDIKAWMDLVIKVKDNFPGLETEEKIAEHRQTVLKFINDKRAVCVKDGDKIVGVLLFSTKYNMICCLAVDAEFRRRGIASSLLSFALARLDNTKDVTVTTFRENDKWGAAPRALYKKFGFVEADLIEEFGYPTQVFLLHPNAR